MSFLDSLEKIMRKRFSFSDNNSMEEGLEEILNIFKCFGEYLNKIDSDDIDSIYDLSEIIWEYHSLKRDYEDFKKGENYMLFKKRDNTITPGKTRINQNINTLKKARDLLKFVSSKDYRNMQGHHGQILNQNEEFIPYAPIQWQEVDGVKKYQELIETDEKNIYLGSYYRDIGLIAFDEIINLYENNEKYEFSNQYRIEKDVFHSYWFISSLIKDLETQSFELFEKSEYYSPEKPTKSNIKKYLKFLREKYNLQVSHNEKQLIDNL